MFTNEDLSSLRELSEASLPDRAAFFTEVDVKGSGGVNTVVPVADAARSEVPCRLGQSGTLAERLRADKVEAAGVWTVVFPLGTDVALKERLVVTGYDLDGRLWSRALRITELATPRSYASQTKVICEEIAP
jgi:hypothetical protein